MVCCICCYIELYSDKMGKIKCKKCKLEKFNVIISPNEVAFICVQCGKQDYIHFSGKIEEKWWKNSKYIKGQEKEYNKII